MVPPEQGTRSHLQFQAGLPSFYRLEWRKQMKQLTTSCSFLIHLNTLRSPLNFPTPLLEDRTHLDECKPEAAFLSAHKHCEGAEQTLFCPNRVLPGSALLTRSRSAQRRWLPFQTHADTHNLNSSPQMHAGSGSKQELLNKLSVLSASRI